MIVVIVMLLIIVVKISITETAGPGGRPGAAAELPADRGSSG